MTESTTATNDTSPVTKPISLVPVRRVLPTVLGAAGLVLAADQLVYGHMPGAGLFSLFVVAAAVIVLVRFGLAPRVPTAIGFAVALAACLPLLIKPHLISVFLALVGVTILALAAWRRLPRSWLDLPVQVWRFVLIAPVRPLYDAIALFSTGSGMGKRVLRQLLTWVVPAVFAGIFLILFSEANPVIALGLGQIDLTALLDPVRVIFWIIIFGFAWPFISLRLARWKRRTETIAPARPESLIFGRAAILNSLIVFNALFAVQTIMDIGYLSRGFGLPEGMSYASYAHRGAYPLIITALLAAGFVLAAMRRGGAGEQSPLIRALVYVWIGQNVLLVLTSILRLDLYVSLYSLTELRAAAFIWMGLVAIGLVLILLRIRLRKSNHWLIALNLYALMLTLFVSSITDFSALIARFNVDHAYEISGEGLPLDVDYFRILGPSTLPVLDAYIARLPERFSQARAAAVAVREDLVYDFANRSQDWRSWTFTDWRIAQYLESGSPLAQSRAPVNN